MSVQEGAVNRLSEYFGRPLLCITHSDRPLEADKCHINYLEDRYSRPGRLPATVSFESLTPSVDHSPYGGQITLHDLGPDGLRPPQLVCEFRPSGFKPQHAIWYDRALWVLGVEHIEVYDADLRSLVRITDPWLAGGHTIAPDGQGRLLVSCSASDSVLVIDTVSHRTVAALRLPEGLYGANYPLTRTDSVVDHYIVNDLQLAHVNCAWPWKRGILTSSLISGALGWFGANQGYTELVRGYVGCHGARVRSDTGAIYFSDSCAGLLVLLDQESLAITQRLGTDSRWLHDALQLSGDVFATALFDEQAVVLWDLSRRTPVGRLDCSSYGGPQFLSFGF